MIPPKSPATTTLENASRNAVRDGIWYGVSREIDSSGAGVASAIGASEGDGSASGRGSSSPPTR